jgi:hypothetical protein
MFKISKEEPVMDRKYSIYKFQPLKNVVKKVFVMKERNGLKTYDCVVCGNFLIAGVNPIQHVKGHKHQNNQRDLEKSIIWRKLREVQDPLLGLEYLVELVRTPKVNLLYVCMLCGFNGNLDEILDHFKGIEHQKKFLVGGINEFCKNQLFFNSQETHFPSYYRHIEDEKLLKILCEEIQELKGRLRPMVCFYEEFDTDPLDIWTRIEKGEHFIEENCMELIDILKERRQLKRKARDESPMKKQIKLEENIRNQSQPKKFNVILKPLMTT